MGQVWSVLQNKYHITEENLNLIIDSIFDRIPSAGAGNTPASHSQANPTADGPKEKTVTCNQLHKAIVEIFKNINHDLHGPDWATPSEEEVDKLLKDSDKDQNDEIDREEFRGFVRKFCSGIAVPYAREMLIVTIAVPVAATLTKRATHRVPVVGGLISKVPNTVFYASASAAALFVRNQFFIKSPSPGPGSDHK